MSDEPKPAPYTKEDCWHPSEEEHRLISNAVLAAIRDHIADLGVELKPSPYFPPPPRPKG